MGSQKGSKGPLVSWHTGNVPPRGGGTPALSVALGELDSAVVNVPLVRLAAVVEPSVAPVVLVTALPLVVEEEALGALLVEEALERPLVPEAVIDEARLAVVAVDNAGV